MLPFLPQKACMGRKCCQQRGLLRAFGEKGTHTARFLPDGPQVRRNARKGCEVYGAARWVTPLGRATQRVAASTGWAWRSVSAGRTAALAGATGRRRDTGECGAGTTLAGMAVWGRDAGGIGGDRKLARRRLGASLAALAGWARRWQARRRGGAGGLTARRARWKRVTVGREGSGLTRRNTPTRVAAIRPNWRALPQRALRALR